MKHLISALLLSALWSPAVLATPDKWDEETKRKCAIVGEAEKRLRKAAPSEDETAIMRGELEQCYDYQLGDMESIVSATHENGFLFPPGMNIVPGKRAIEAAYRSFSAANAAAAGYELAWDPIDAFVSGNMGWAYGLTRSKAPGEAPRIGKYVSVWVKENDKWFYVAEIRNFND